MNRTAVRILALVIVLVTGMSLLALCAGCGKKELVVYTMDDADSGKLTPSQEANLRTIEGAIMTYWADTNKYPTDINQLVPKYLKKVPTDDKGGVYVLKTGADQPQAGVKF